MLKKRVGRFGWRSAFLALIAIAALAASCAGSKRPPDIVFITVDTLRADRVGAYGCGVAKTPNIDRLAASGLRFDNALTPFPRTTPAVASMLTGLEPRNHGSLEVGRPVLGVPSVVSVLQRHGYATIGISANPAASVRQGIAAGFDRFVKPIELGARLAETVTDRALELMGQETGEEPVFLWLLYVDPHLPYAPPASWTDQPRGQECRRLQLAVDSRKISWGEMFLDRNGVSSRALDDCRALYDAEIAYVDFQIGRLLEGLEISGRLDDAIVVFTSDHGENLGENGFFFEHGPSVHDASLRVPLIISGPSVTVGVDNEIVRLQDLAPTLLGVAEIDRGSWPEMDGVDLGPRLLRPVSETDGKTEIAFAESGSHLHAGFTTHIYSGPADGTYCYHDGEFALCGGAGRPFRIFDPMIDPKLNEPLDDPPGPRLEALLRAREIWLPEDARERTARTAWFKLVEIPALDGGYHSSLYDLRADPGETTDVSDRWPEIRKRLENGLHRWADGFRYPVVPGLRSPEEIEALRALGYLE